MAFKTKIFFSLLALSTLTFSGCKRYYLEVAQQVINRDYLASTHVGSPDPLQCNPLYGRQLIISWQIPQEILNENPHVDLDIIFWNYTEERITYGVDAKRGYVLYTLAGSEYERMKGILSYKARLVTQNGRVYRDWEQQLWVDLIQIENEEFTPPPQPTFPSN